jgi:hypothetical protein
MSIENHTSSSSTIKTNKDKLGTTTTQTKSSTGKKVTLKLVGELLNKSKEESSISTIGYGYNNVI